MNNTERYFLTMTLGITLMAAGLLSGCDTADGRPTTKLGTSMQPVTLYSVDHDGHKFVVMSGTEGKGSFLHHPECWCRKVFLRAVYTPNGAYYQTNWSDKE